MTGQHHPPQKQNPLWLVLAVILALFAVGSIIVWLGTQHSSDGSPLIQDAGGLLGAIVAALGAIAAAAIPTLRKIQASTQKTEEHVVNSHGATNLRDDIDDIKAGISAIAHAQEEQGKVQREQGKDILGLRQEIGQIRKTERDQWEAIEDTAASIRRRRKDD